MAIDIDKGFPQVKFIPNSKGSLIEIRKYKDQSQAYEQVTRQMSLVEAVEWAANTTTFKPLIREHKYAVTFTRYAIVKPVVDGKRITETVECLWEIVINKSSVACNL